MLEQIPLLLATPIAKIVLEKFYEGFGSKLGEKAIELATMPIQEVGKLAWAKCFAGKGQDELLVPGTVELRTGLKEALLLALDDPAFVEQVKPIAQQIQQAIVQIDDDSTMTQNNYGGTNYQTKTGLNNTNFLGGEHHHHH